MTECVPGLPTATPTGSCGRCPDETPMHHKDLVRVLRVAARMMRDVCNPRGTQTSILAHLLPGISVFRTEDEDCHFFATCIMSLARYACQCARRKTPMEVVRDPIQ